MNGRANGTDPEQVYEPLTTLAVSGFKSIRDEQSIEIRPLTILAGANSSGKSSMMQTLLLLKQTLEASYDPGPLLLNGPNVKFTSLGQLFTQGASRFQIVLGATFRHPLAISFARQQKGGLRIEQTVQSRQQSITIREGMTPDDLKQALPEFASLYSQDRGQDNLEEEWLVNRSRCFLEVHFRGTWFHNLDGAGYFTTGEDTFAPGASWTGGILGLIHIPGLRGNPERSYPVTAVGSSFPGTFENYVASVLAHWQANKGGKKLTEVGRDLQDLGLTWKVVAKQINDTQVELQIGRLTAPGARGGHDLVNIADAGLGVSQTLPVIVALHAAQPGQLVYIEQPEIHLHPRAQTALARVLARAAQRGVRVVAETHSSLLLLGIQTLVAEGELSPELVKLHWFERQDGITKITSHDLDETGAFGDWPEDFADVTLELQSRYLDAAEQRMFKRA